MDASPTPDFDDSTIYTLNTPSSSIADLPDDGLHNINSSVPSNLWDASTTTIDTPPESVTTSRLETRASSRTSNPSSPSLCPSFRVIFWLLPLIFLFLRYHYHISPKPISSIPWPDSTYMIRSVDSGKVLTLLGGQVILSAPSKRGSTLWKCIDTKGWLGFQSPVSNRFLGHDVDGWLRCVANRQQGWENFCVRMTKEGGFVLMMQHWERLWYVAIVTVDGVERLVKAGEVERAIVWEFVKVA